MIRARTSGEVRAYTQGWMNCILMAREQGLEAAAAEGLIMAQVEWPEYFNEDGTLKSPSQGG